MHLSILYVERSTPSTYTKDKSRRDHARRQSANPHPCRRRCRKKKSQRSGKVAQFRPLPLLRLNRTSKSTLQRLPLLRINLTPNSAFRRPFRGSEPHPLVGLPPC